MSSDRECFGFVYGCSIRSDTTELKTVLNGGLDLQRIWETNWIKSFLMDNFSSSEWKKSLAVKNFRDFCGTASGRLESSISAIKQLVAIQLRDSFRLEMV